MKPDSGYLCVREDCPGRNCIMRHYGSFRPDFVVETDLLVEVNE